MKSLLILSLFFGLTTGPVWLTDYDEAVQEARKSEKNILINFSGSDWCIPCIKMEKELFHSSSFETFANKQLVLVKADFPRLKKNKLSNEQISQNEKLAARYNPEGKFPFTVLIGTDGHVIKSWEGYSVKNPDGFIGEINSCIHAVK